MAHWIVVSLAFFGEFLAVIAANAVLTELASRERRRINEEVRSRVPATPRPRPRPEHPPPRPVPFQTAAGAGRPHHAIGPEHHGAKLIFWAFAVAVIGGTTCWVLTDNALVAAVAAAGCTAPLLFVLRARQKRRDKLLTQLPDTFEAMSRVLRSGQTISRAMKIVADDGAPPSRWSSSIVTNRWTWA